jgi:hypothetical protein
MHRSLARQDKNNEITLLNFNSIRNNHPSLKRHSSTLRELKDSPFVTKSGQLQFKTQM